MPGRVAYLAGVTERERYLTPGEVAEIFSVDPKTVTRWGNSGKLPSVRTPGGHHRFPESGVRAFLEATGGDGSRVDRAD